MVAADVQAPDSPTRFHGVFAPGSTLRPLVVPRPEEPRRKRPARPPPDITGTFLEALPKRPREPPLPARYRIPWAQLLERVFGVDVLSCSKCKGPMTLLAFIEKPSAVGDILRHLGLPDTSLPVARSRGPAEHEGAFRFLPDPTDDDVRRLLERTSRRIMRALFAELGEGADDEADALTALDAASLIARQTSMSFVSAPQKRLCAALDGFSPRGCARATGRGSTAYATTAPSQALACASCLTDTSATR